MKYGINDQSQVPIPAWGLPVVNENVAIASMTTLLYVIKINDPRIKLKAAKKCCTLQLMDRNLFKVEYNCSWNWVYLETKAIKAHTVTRNRKHKH